MESVRRVVNQEFHGIGDVSVGEITPLVYLQNHFFLSTYYHVHDGIGFMCRVDKTVFNAINERQGERVSIAATDVGSIDNRLVVGSDRKVFECAKEEIKHRIIKEYDEEIVASRSVAMRIRVHNLLIKPIFGLCGRGIGKRILMSEIRKGIEESAAACRLLDISCGEDRSLFELSKLLPNGSIVVGNDVAWESLATLIKQKVRNRVANVYFTNHSSAEAPYRAEAFDISVCKNSLHHMRDYREAVGTIKTLIRVTKAKVIIIDFEHPRKSGLGPSLFNCYYRYILRDQGHNFLTYDEFQRLFLQEELGSMIESEGFNVRTGCEKSLFGNAMWAILDRRRHIADSPGGLSASVRSMST